MTTTESAAEQLPRWSVPPAPSEFAQYRQDPQAFGAHCDDALSRAGINTAEELGQVFGFDVTDGAFWTASLDVIRQRMASYKALATEVV